MDRDLSHYPEEDSASNASSSKKPKRMGVFIQLSEDKECLFALEG